MLLQLRRRGRLPACGFPQIRTALEDRSGNPQLLHFADQRSALQAKFGRCAVRASDHPSGRFKCVQNHGAFGVFKSSMPPEKRLHAEFQQPARDWEARHSRKGSRRVRSGSAARGYCPANGRTLSADMVSGGICSICLPNRRPRISTKCVTSAGMSSRRSRKGGSMTGNTFRR